MNMIMGMWDNGCKVMHGMIDEEKRKIKRDMILLKAQRYFQTPEGVMEYDQHLFSGGLGEVD